MKRIRSGGGVDADISRIVIDTGSGALDPHPRRNGSKCGNYLEREAVMSDRNAEGIAGPHDGTVHLVIYCTPR